MKLLKYTLLTIVSFTVSASLSAQCVAEITMDPDNGSQNMTVQFYGNGVTPGAGHDFNTPGLPTGWSSSDFTSGSPCQVPEAHPSPDGSDYFWIGNRDGNLDRYIQSPSLDVSNGGKISFELRYGEHPLSIPTSDCRGPFIHNMGVALEYSLDGTTWTQITYYDPEGTDTIFSNWNYFEYDIPVAAQSSSTMFRWFQDESSHDSYDKWGLDNIEIDADLGVDSYSWDFGDGSPLSNEQNPEHTYADYGSYSVSLTITTPEPCTDTKDTTLYINSTPTIDDIVQISINSTDLSLDIPLTGITDGGIGGQTLSLSAVSSNPSSLAVDNLAYTSPQTTATLTVVPDSMMCGDATITTTVEYTNLETISYDELFTVNVVDKTLPVLSDCPDDIVKTILPGKCDTIITFTAPTGSDNCAGYSIVQTSGLPSGSAFPTGTTLNEFTLTDASGNKVSCAFTVTITESIPPTITCPDDILAAECNNTLTIPAPIAADNCGIESVIHNSPYGASYEDASGTYPVGITTITWTVTDLSGNTATCEQRIEISPNPVQPTAPDISVSYGETTLLTATPDADHYIRWYENSDLSDVPVESSTLDLGFLTPETYYRYASQVSNITGCEGLARPVEAVVNKAELTVTAQDSIITYGDPIPETIPFSYTGFVFSEDESVINEDPAISIDADENSDAGTYSIGFTGGYDNNYSFSFVNGTLTIEKADQTISFDALPSDLRVSEEYTLVASATSGLPVVFSFSDPGIASLSGDLITILKEGSTSVYANNDGGTNYKPAPEAVQLLSTLPAFDNSNSLFTPNGDGYNDYWHIPFIADLGTVKVKVYNRQGKLVYDSKAYANDWDGTFNGNPLPEGAYYYIIEAGDGSTTKGVVNIVR